MFSGPLTLFKDSSTSNKHLKQLKFIDGCIERGYFSLFLWGLKNKCSLGIRALELAIETQHSLPFMEWIERKSLLQVFRERQDHLVSVAAEAGRLDIVK